MRTGHLSVQQGKRVLVLMRDGNHILAKFKQRKGRFIEFFDHESIRSNLIRTLSLYKEPASKVEHE